MQNEKPLVLEAWTAKKYRRRRFELKNRLAALEKLRTVIRMGVEVWDDSDVEWHGCWTVEEIDSEIKRCIARMKHDTHS